MMQVLILKVLKGILYNLHFDASKLAQPIINVLFQILSRDHIDENAPFDGNFLQTKQMAASLIAKLADRVREDLPDFKSQLYRIFLDSFFKERTIQI